MAVSSNTKRTNRHVVVFAGIEGLLFDRSATDFDGAASIVDALERRGVPLVLCSGRTRAELEYIQQRIGVRHPLICEHGAAACAPLGYFGSDDLLAGRVIGNWRVLEFGRPYLEVVDALHRLAARVGVEIVGFSDMSVHDVASDAGVPLLQAHLAKLRDYEEPYRLVTHDEGRRARLCRALQSASLGCVSDGRYDYAGSPVDLGVGMQWLMTLYRRIHGTVVTVGIGDKSHHLPLLRRVDIPIIVWRDDSVTSRLLSAAPRATLFDGTEPHHLASIMTEFLDDPATLGEAI